MSSGAMKKLCAGLSLSAGLLLAGNAATAEETPPLSPSAMDRGAQVSVAPLRIELADAETAASLRVHNPSGRTIGVQLRIFGWRQVGGQDSYFASSDVMISPSIIQIAPGDTQIFRIVRKDAAGDGEKRFRIAIDQLPDPALERAGEAQARLRFTLPLFIDRNRAAPVRLDWSMTATGLQVTNAGGQTARIVNLAATDGAGRTIPLEHNGLRYVQGGSTISWPLAGGCPTGPVSIAASIDGQKAHAQAPALCH